MSQMEKGETLFVSNWVKLAWDHYFIFIGKLSSTFYILK